MPRNPEPQLDGPFYRKLGRNLRVARSTAGKSQTDVAKCLGVTFQQVQKYEKGTNRIPVDCLVKLAAYLEVPLLKLIDPSDSDSEFQTLAGKFGARELHSFMEAWGRIKDRPLRTMLLNLARHMADLKC
jgi:transcriptional regulator with XRE-family HTH domain